VIQFEHTDTFGGEANYCWVKRLTLTKDAAEDHGIAYAASANVSDRSIVRAAKAFAGFTGMRCDVLSWGDGFAIRPREVCQVVFVQWI
jgi:hypothetical protein